MEIIENTIGWPLLHMAIDVYVYSLEINIFMFWTSVNLAWKVIIKVSEKM